MPPRKPSRPELAADREAVREASLRGVFRRGFSIIASGQAVCPDEWDKLRSRYQALLDDVGPGRAPAIRGEEAVLWQRETKRCAWCGGPPHQEEP